MNGQRLQTTTLGEIIVANRLKQGAQGEVWEITQKPTHLLKVCKPEDSLLPNDLVAYKKDSTYRYTAFSKLKFGNDKEVSCLPLEYIEVNYDGPTPAYLMQRGRGREMKLNADFYKLDILKRLQIAQSLASAMNHLHGRHVVHADFKPENFFYDEISGFVQILDIDGGGYFGPEHEVKRFCPNIPSMIPLYSAPELVRRDWKSIWEEPTLIKQPDLWALAVMLYQILVDKNGPFPVRAEKDDPNYQFFRRGDFCRDAPDWPRNWQLAEMKKINLDTDLIDMFTKVFSATYRVQIHKVSRPDAFQWRKFLGEAIKKEMIRRSPPPPPPVVVQPVQPPPIAPPTQPSLPPIPVQVAKESDWERFRKWLKKVFS
jgi:serine/threonine protein kinase